MRITHEADYAIRVTYCLALAGEKQCAKDISEVTGVTLRFALKILRKLTQSGITKSYKGVAGGYELNHSPSEISLGAIIECIDGPITINHCLANEFQCTHMGTQKECDFHRVFSEINRSLRDQLCSIMADLRANFEGECSEVGMYLAMARVAHREGYPEIGLYWEKAAFEEAEHAAKFAELLGEVVTDSTEKNLQMRVDAENGATAGKFDLAKRAKALNLDAIHDTVHEMARDEARHGKAFEGLLKRYFNK